MSTSHPPTVWIHQPMQRYAENLWHIRQCEPTEQSLQAKPSLDDNCWVGSHLHRNSFMIEASLEVKLPTVWTDEAEEVGRVREETTTTTATTTATTTTLH